MDAALLAYWQRQLRLEDWDIQIDEVPARVLDGAAGLTSVHAHRRCARIRIAEVATLDPDAGPDFCDAEATLVHELLHVALSGVGDHHLIEGPIDSLARALVRINRGERR